jgi:hypothetical protein
LCAILGGCSSVPAGKSVVSDLSKNPDDTEVQFWHDMESRPMATNDDAFHGLLLYLDGSDASSDYDARVATLKQRQLLPADFHGGEDDAIERGTLAVVLVKALHLKGGLSMRLFGPLPRYAVRELEYRNIFPDSSENQLFSGAEFVGIMGRVEDFLEGDPANYPAKVLYVGAEPTPTLDEMAAADDPPKFLSTMASNMTLLDPSSEPASEPSSQPAPLKLPEGPLTLIVTGIRGKAEVRIPPDETWKKAEQNEELKEGAELRTGLKSAVQLQIRPDQTITVDRLGVVKIDRATLASGKFVTTVSMTSGRVRYDIDAANREYDATVRSPNSTLGIRGTQVSLLDQRPFPPQAVSLTGTAQFRNIHRQLVALGRKGQGKTIINGDQNSATEYALQQAVVDPTVANARTESEQPLVASLLSRGAVSEFDRNLGIPVVSGGTVPQTDAQLIPLLPGNLDFVARWSANVNIDLAVFTPPTTASPQGEVILAAPGLTHSLSGGQLAFDHRGGPNGGIEVVHWDTPNFPTGPFYGVVGTNNSNVTARVRIDAYLNHTHYNNENSIDGDVINQLNISSGATLVNNGYVEDVPPGLSMAILYDVQLPPSIGATPQSISSSPKKSKKTVNQPTASATNVQPPLVTSRSKKN